MENNDIIDSTELNQRKYRRFNMRYPVRFRLQSEGVETEIETTSENVSIGGLLVRSAAEIPLGTPVRFTIRLHSRGAIRPKCLYLVGDGEVVRVQSSTNDGTFAIAVACKVPVSQVLVSHGGSGPP